MSDVVFEHMQPREHVLHRPAMYVGPTTPTDVECVIFSAAAPEPTSAVPGDGATADNDATTDNDATAGDAAPVRDTMAEDDAVPEVIAASKSGTKRTSVAWNAETCVLPATSPALFKLFDEAVVNALDNTNRDSTQKYIKIEIDPASGVLCVQNDGRGIPIEKYKDSQQWLPTVIFSEFLSGSNFDDSQARFTGGCNGVGIKATITWSRWAEIQLVTSGKRFVQRFEDNMSVKQPPKISSVRTKTNSVTLRWLPDYTRMGMPDVAANGLSERLAQALGTRAYDASVCAKGAVSVYLNERKLALRTPQQYALAMGALAPLACDTFGDEAAWTVCCGAAAPGRGAVAAFVNGVKCNAGTHVDFALRKIAEIALAKARAKAKQPELAGKGASFLRQELVLVISAQVSNPRFTSQTKEQLESKVAANCWGPTDAFRSAVERSELIERIIRSAAAHEEKSLQKLTKVSRSSLMHIEKYDPAALAGKRGAHECTLLVTEGDSAKSLAIAGLSVVGRDRFGCFPIRGKLMNVLRYADKRVLGNREIANLLQILGLEYGKVYTEEAARALPYRHLAIFSDQDHDGSHIAGLIMNLLHAHFRSLLAVRPDFVKRFATPIVRASLPGGAGEQSFFSLVEHEEWRRAREAEGLAPAPTKYFKGLGTSTNKMAKEYFRAWDEHVIAVTYDGAPTDGTMRLFFDEKATSERKTYLRLQYNPQSFVDYSRDATTMDAFLTDEMSHFSFYDTKRSIPSAIDGLKPSQRKVLCAFLNQNITKDTKVAQACAMVAERMAYHHGEVSLGEAIVGLAQDFVGTNNIALLEPSGQFGTRHNKPSVHSALRYIFTRLDPIARVLFPRGDDAVLEYLEDDGQRIEPKHYVPVLPLVLVNGGAGIGTGWSSSTPNFNPRDVLRMCREKAAHLQGTEAAPAAAACESPEAGAAAPPDWPRPWYDGHTGEVMVDDDAYVTHGRIAAETATTLRITELPVGRWIEDFLDDVRAKHLCASARDATAARFVQDVTNNSTDTRVDITLHCASGHTPSVEAAVKVLKLTSKLSMRNINLFDASDRLVEGLDVAAIVDMHARARLALYEKRRAHQIEQLERDALRLGNRARFLACILDDSLDLRRLSAAETDLRLAELGFDALPTYEYLVSMQFRAINTDKVAELERERDALRDETRRLRETDAFAMWRAELDAFEVALAEYDARKATANAAGEPADGDARAPHKKKRGGGGVARKKQKLVVT